MMIPRTVIVEAILAHPRAHLREVRGGWALAVRVHVAWVPVTVAYPLAGGDLVTSRARVAGVREHLAGAWAWTAGRRVREPSILDTIAVRAWADGAGVLRVHDVPARPRHPAEAPTPRPPRAVDGRQLDLLAQVP